jgi:hypothetical protein
MALDDPAADAGEHRETAGCTIVAMNYLAYAKVLAESWRRVHPAAPFTALVLDIPEGEDLALSFEAIGPADLGLDPAELRIQRAVYGPLELATALKPHLLRLLLARGRRSAIYLDPDTKLFGSLNDLAAAAVASGVCLVPHVLTPIPLDNRSPSELEIQVTGIFNLGLVAVGDGGVPFLDWWAERLRRHCVMRPQDGLFVDQRWVDWVPSLFSHTISRDPGIDVAFWNLHERRVTSDGPTFTVNGQHLLRHFHFSGFDPAQPRILTSYEVHYPMPFRDGVRDQPAVRDLCATYAEEIDRAGFRETRDLEYGFGRTANGMPLGSWGRTVYREAVLAAEASGARMPPSPFDPGEVTAFERLVGVPVGGSLPARTRARLEQLRAKTSDRPRRAPTSRHGRLYRKARLTAAGALGRQASGAPGTDEALLNYLEHVERRLGEPVDVRDDSEDILREGARHPRL